jgi:ABC-type oligopeptide transport system substrate-binding subunit
MPPSSALTRLFPSLLLIGITTVGCVLTAPPDPLPTGREAISLRPRQVAHQAPVRPADLLPLAEDAPESVASLYRSVALAADRIKLANGDQLDVEPVGPDTLLNLADFEGSMIVKEIMGGDMPARSKELTRVDIVLFIPYERHALEQIIAFEKSATDLPALQRLVVSEKALAVVAQFHRSVRDRKPASRWEDWQTLVDGKLMDVRKLLLRQRAVLAVSEEEWHAALRFGDEMVAAYAGRTKNLLADVARVRTRHAAFLLLHPAGEHPSPRDYALIRKDLEWVEEHLKEAPGSDEGLGDLLGAPALRLALQRRAAALVAAAHNDPKGADKLLREAAEIWPRLPELRKELQDRQKPKVILYVGVRNLPKYLSPARACTDAELQAVELLFEGLLQARPAEGGGLSYAPQLAAGFPQMVNNERRFVLQKGAYWSNGDRVRAADVQKTYDLLTSASLLGHSSELDWLEPIRAGEEPFRVEVRLRQGLLDSQALLTFKVLPHTLTAADDEKFALAPVGSGPFRLAGELFEDGRTYVRFVANPQYFDRTGHPVSKIHEVRFFAYRDPAAELAHKTAPVHLLLDLTTQDLARIKAGTAEIRSGPTRRVWFLAVNHRDDRLADESLRRALAHGLDRERLLADHFGGGRPGFHTGAAAVWGAGHAVMAAALLPRGAARHHPLNGPYPADSWACCTDGRVPARLFNPALAEAHLKMARGNAFELELKYPDDDPRIAEACQALAQQLADLGAKAGKPIMLRLVPRSPYQLRQDLNTRNYQLAFTHHDFANDAYSLWPLFDPDKEALETGSNYLGFNDNGVLAEALKKASKHRDFAEVKRLTQDIHALLFERMPLIPLWQLDAHLAVHPRLKLPTVDPLRVFSTIDEWQLRAP